MLFNSMIDDIIAKDVDFVIVAGDTFHTNIPEMRVQKIAFNGFRKLYNAGLAVYGIYGSHDFSPVSHSVIDLITSAGYMQKLNGLTPTIDKKTKCMLFGISGMKRGRDREIYESIDQSVYDNYPNPKIFVFHGGLSELDDEESSEYDDSMPINLLPPGFSYYAGGHGRSCGTDKGKRSMHVY